MKKQATLKTLFGLSLIVSIFLSISSLPLTGCTGSPNDGATSGGPNISFTGSLMKEVEPLWVTIDGNGILCPGGLAHDLGAFPSGGTPPYTYLWSNGMTEETLYDVPAGQYSVTVTDATGATAVASTILEQPDPIIIYEASVFPFTCTAPAIVTVGATGGTPKYTFEWSNGVNGTTSNLSPGDLPVTITVTDKRNCPETYIISTLPADTAAPIIMAMGGVLTCKTPVINLSAEGSDDGPCFEFFWEGPDDYQAYKAYPPVNKPGIYTLTISNVCNGCISTTTAEVFEDKVIPMISVYKPVDTFSCGIPVIEIDACFSVGNSFSWSTANGMVAYGADSCVLGVALPGVYTLSLSNPNDGCTATLDVTVGGIGSPLMRIDSIQHARCYGAKDGYVQFAVIGGMSPYALLWPDSSDLSVRADLGAGSYVITLTDDAGCQSSNTLTIQQPDQIISNLELTHESAPGAKDGSVTIDPQHGVPPYIILWSTGDTTPTIAGLAPGTYGVTVTDSIGCSIHQTFQIDSFGCQLALEAVTASVACHGDQTGSIVLSINNPIGSYTILWSNGENGEMVDGLGAGIYTVVVIDSAGCVYNGSYEITSPPPIVITLDSLIQESAAGASDGAIYISINGGVGNYTYQWTNDMGVVVGNQQNIQDIEEGAYELCITDDNGCVQCQVFSIMINAISPSWRDEVRVYPNPVRDILSIFLPDDDHFHVEVYSVLGVAMYKQNAFGNLWQIPVETWPPGIYWLIVRNEKGQMGIYKVIR